MDCDSDPDFEVAALALFFVSEVLKISFTQEKKKTLGTSRGILCTSAKASSSSMLHLFVFPIAVFSCTSICNSDKIPHGNS